MRTQRMQNESNHRFDTGVSGGLHVQILWTFHLQSMIVERLDMGGNVGAVRGTLELGWSRQIMSSSSSYAREREKTAIFRTGGNAIKQDSGQLSK